MTRAKRLIPFLCLPMLLTSCILFPDDGEWKKEYGTPELFLENVRNPKCYLYEDQSQYFDGKLEIKDAIAACAPFSPSEKKTTTVDRYFTYQAYWTPATSGPNYCNMSIWEDGYMVIHHKTSLGPHSYAYFVMEPSRAVALNDLVFSKLPKPAE